MTLEEKLRLALAYLRERGIGWKVSEWRYTPSRLTDLRRTFRRERARNGQ